MRGGRTNGAVHFKLHRISVHLIQRYWGLVLKQDSFNASSAGLIRLMNGGPWKDQKEPFLVLKTARAGPRLFAHFLPKSCATSTERMPSTMRGNPILGHMLWIDVCPSVCVSVSARVSSGLSCPTHLEIWGLQQTVLWNGAGSYFADWWMEWFSVFLMQL